MGIWLRLGCSAASLWLILASAAHAEPLRLRYTVWVGYGPLFVAAEKGFFAREGVEVDLIQIEDHTAALAALFAGQVDALATATQDVVLFNEPDEEALACVLALDDSQGGDGILATNDIRTIAELKGKSVAFGYRGISQFYVNVLLKEAGLSEADIEVVDLPADKAAEAFMMQEVDAAVTWEPYLTQGRSVAHGHVLTDSSERPGLLGDCLMTKPSIFSARKEEFRALARAWDAAVQYVEAHPDEANEIMARSMGDWLADPAVVAETGARGRVLRRGRESGLLRDARPTRSDLPDHAVRDRGLVGPRHAQGEGHARRCDRPRDTRRVALREART